MTEQIFYIKLAFRNDFHNLEEGDDAECFAFSNSCQVKLLSIVRVALSNWNHFLAPIIRMSRALQANGSTLVFNSVAQKNQDIFVWLTKLFNKLSTLEQGKAKDKQIS